MTDLDLLDALVEMVRLIDPHLAYDDDGQVGIVAGRNFHTSSTWDVATIERFSRALTHIRHPSPTPPEDQ